MSKKPDDQGKAELYEIRIRGHLDNRWAGWFEGMTITREANGETRLTGPVVDQAALHGLLKKVRNLGIPLVSVIQLDPIQENTAQVIAISDHNHPEKEDKP